MQKVVGAANPKTTVTLNSTDTASTLETLGATVETSAPANTNQAKYAIISVEDAAVRVGMEDASTTLGHLWQPGDIFVLEDAYEVAKAKFISAVAGAHATLQVTTEF